MNQYMIAQVAYTKQSEDGTFKRVKEQFLVPGFTYSTAEEFVFSTLAEQMRGEVMLDSLKREAVEDIFVMDDDIQEGWYKCKVVTQDPESEKIKNITSYYYVNASSVGNATTTLEESLSGSIAEFEIKSTVLSPIVDVFEPVMA